MVQLHLGTNQITNLPNLEKMTQLKQLGLSDNSLGPFFQEQPDYNFPPTLESLNLAQNQLTVCPLLSNLRATITFVCLFFKFTFYFIFNFRLFFILLFNIAISLILPFIYFMLMIVIVGYK